MPDTSEVWIAKDVLRLSEGYAPDSRVGNALRAFAAQLGDREREDGAGRAAATALQADIRSALGVVTGRTDEGYGGTGSAPQQPQTDNLADLAARLLAALDDGNPRHAKVRQAIFELPGGAG